ncbi:hypothetical protein B9Z55_008554 [Caenorhabditis nigoni]|uniref:Uncharacterized protein n=1 Tax=Caenorhabditis nigoni TaxID=1611254 RepID=A0A2G5UN15_9PELO|nr:hypothetical protein B9Z55_008554 [Caenorhabditis nigoni]
MSFPTWLIYCSSFVIMAGSQMTVDLPPLRSNDMVIPVSNRFAMSWLFGHNLVYMNARALNSIPIDWKLNFTQFYT